MIREQIDLQPIDFSETVEQIAEESLCIFCHSSYEDRCRAIESLVLSNKCVLFSALFASAEYSNLPSYQSNTAQLNRWLKQKKGVRHHRAIIPAIDALDWLETLVGQMSALKIPEDTGLLVDVTTFPRDRMYLLLDYLFLKYPRNSIYVTYFEPREYSTESDNNGWLSRDVHTIRSIPRLNGRIRIGAKRLLAIVVGHEGARAYGTVIAEESDKVVAFGQRKEQDRQNAPEISNAIVEQLCADFQGTVRRDDILYLESRDIQATEAACLNLHIKYHENYDISLVSYGSKLQSIGTLLAARGQKDIRLIHSKVQAYNTESYSKGIGSGWIAEIGRYARSNTANR